MVPDNLHFRSDRPFYPFVIAFFAGIAGLQAFVDPSNPLGIRRNQRLRLGGLVHSHFSISTFGLFEHFQAGAIKSRSITAGLCCMLANASYEAVRSRSVKSPEQQFFRHIRNASSHGNSFYFAKHEPAHPAVWRTRTIAQSPKGDSHPLAKTTCFFDYLGPADLVLLLWDIEQQHP